MSFDLSIYAALFLAAFLAATIIPAQSELLLAGLLMAGNQPVWALITVAWIANTGGSVVNWFLGTYLHHLAGRRWFPMGEESLAKAVGWYGRYGRWSLLLSWVPIIGDPLTLAAGLLREPLKSFVLIVGSAKLARYLVVATLALKWNLFLPAIK